MRAELRARTQQRTLVGLNSTADKVAGWFVPAVIVVALLAFIGWAVFGPSPALSYALIAAVSVVIIACPCALVLRLRCRSWAGRPARVKLLGWTAPRHRVPELGL
jgi:predicted membrane metal-binding protein